MARPVARPNIGITAATEKVSYGVWEEVPAFMSPASYVRAVQRAGGRPILLPPDPEDAEDPKGVLELVDSVPGRTEFRVALPGTPIRAD